MTVHSIPENSDKWLDLSEDELLVAMGHALTSERLHARPPSAAEMIGMANDWLGKSFPRIASAICASARVKQHVNNHERALLFEATCEVVVHLVAHVPAGCVAAYCIRLGVDKLCSKRWAT